MFWRGCINFLPPGRLPAIALACPLVPRSGRRAQARRAGRLRLRQVSEFRKLGSGRVGPTLRPVSPTGWPPARRGMILRLGEKRGRRPDRHWSRPGQEPWPLCHHNWFIIITSIKTACLCAEKHRQVDLWMWVYLPFPHWTQVNRRIKFNV